MTHLRLKDTLPRCQGLIADHFHLRSHLLPPPRRLSRRYPQCSPAGLRKAFQRHPHRPSQQHRVQRCLAVQNALRNRKRQFHYFAFNPRKILCLLQSKYLHRAKHLSPLHRHAFVQIALPLLASL